MASSSSPGPLVCMLSYLRIALRLVKLWKFLFQIVRFTLKKPSNCLIHKSGDKLTPGNYRPISNVPSLMKFLERSSENRLWPS